MTTVRRALTILFPVLFALPAGVRAADAPGGQRTVAVVPGDRIQPELLAAAGGPAARGVLAELGQRPLLLLWWRPRDAFGEQVLVRAVALAKRDAPHAVLVPIAALGADQPVEDVKARLAANALADLKSELDDGRLALLFGLPATPALALIDRGGVLRMVGGGDVTQNAPGGLRVIDALALASKGEAVPTLGALKPVPTYRLLGQKMIDADVTPATGGERRPLLTYAKAGAPLLVVYWSPQCPHCREALPRLRAWVDAHPGTKLTIVDVARGDIEVLRTGAAEFLGSAPWTHTYDVDRTAGRIWMVAETPAALVVTPDGSVAAVASGGSIDWARLIEPWL